MEKINAIGIVTLESETVITEARTAYDALTDGQKAQISADTLAVLTDAEATFAQLNAYEEAALALEAQIKAIAPQPAAVKLSQKAEVEAAKAVYMAFSDGAKEYFNTNCKTAYNMMNGFFNVLNQKEAKLEAAVKAINDIGTQITLESETAITTARTTYDKLQTDVQEAVSAETLKILTDAEAALEQLKEEIEAVKTAIGAIGTVTLESETVIAEARKAYDALTDSQKAQITAEELARLTDAEAAFVQLKAEELAAAKAAAKKEIEEYKNVDDYRTAEKAELATIIAEVKAAIDSSDIKTVEAVTVIVTNAKAAMDKIKTDAQLDKEEADAAKPSATPTPTPASTATPAPVVTTKPVTTPAPTTVPETTPTATPAPEMPKEADTTITEIVVKEEVVEAVKETVTVKEGTATVEKETIEAVVEASKEETTVVLPLAQSTEDVVNKAEISTEALEAVAEAEKDIVIELTDVTVKLDADTVKAIAEQAQGKTVEIRAVETEKQYLTEEQHIVLENKDVAVVITVQIFSDGQYIGDFKGGKATIKLPFHPAEGKNGKDHAVYFVADNGETTKVPSEFVDGHMIFTTSHFSDYVIVYEGDVITGETQTVVPETPVTETAAFPVLPVVIVVLLAAAIVAVVAIKKKNEK